MKTFSKFKNNLSTYWQARRLDRSLKNSEIFELGELQNTVKSLKAFAEGQDLQKVGVQRKYLATATPTFHQSNLAVWLKVGEVGFASALLILVVSFVAASEPGEALHPYKTAAKQFRITLSPSAEDRARASLSMAREQLSATKEILVKENETPEKKRAAVAELTRQTKSVIERVSKATENTQNASSVEKEKLIQDLSILALDQLEMVRTVSADLATQDTAELVKSATDNAEAIAKISQVLAVSGDSKTVDKNDADSVNGVVKLEGDAAAVENEGTSKVVGNPEKALSVPVDLGGGEEEIAPEISTGFIPEPATENADF